MYGGGGMDLFSSYGRAGQGPPKYGQLPAIPPVYRADQLLSALQIPRAYREPAFAFAIVDSYIASKKARGHAPWYIGSKLELLEAKVSHLLTLSPGPSADPPDLSPFFDWSKDRYARYSFHGSPFVHGWLVPCSHADRDRYR